MLYAEARDIAHALAKSLTPYCEKIAVAGSLRRGRSDVKDVEICVVPKWIEQDNPADLFGDEKMQVNRLYAEWGALPTCPVRWIKTGTRDIVPWQIKPDGKYWRGALPSGLKLDLFIATPQNWGAIYLIRTGSAEFSQEIVTHAKRVGYHFEGGNLWRGEQLIPTPTEAHIFEYLGLQWVEPKLRTGAADVRRK